MLNYKDKAFCGSSDCINECGRKITDKELKEAKKLDLLISYANFCDIPQDISQLKEEKGVLR